MTRDHSALDFTWDRFFARGELQRTPAVWKHPCPWPLSSPKEAIDVLARACEEGSIARVPESECKIRLFRDGVLSELDPQRIPRATDASPEHYIERLQAATPGETIGLILNDYHCLDDELWRRIRGFFRAWFERTGMPAGGATADIFLASYPVTPFGVHQDTQDVFTWVVSGEKRFLVWPPEVFDGVDPRTVDYEDYRDRATVLEGAPGDLMFWPSTHWHIAESVGAPVVTLSLGRFMDSAQDVALDDARAFFVDATAVEGLDRTPRTLERERRSVQALPEPLRAATEHVRQRMEDAIHRRWLERRSNAGLPPPPSRTTPLPASARIAADPAFPILWAESREGLLVAGAGRALLSPDAPWLPALLDVLNQGVPLAPSELLDGLDHDGLEPGWRARAMDTIARLYSFRALS
ncbi:JmjC domain-containing protein [Paraliomyxa miuraensis]|uniref:JmjC domain-containing protein n=1 Tax=Paraliomyxa miuraensis TaxID=376150 RepID=UPI002251C94D|nr:cupin domain-containing protein [Paraliomyxa miuraensis]MCX4247771.1 cupin-like domain-containing protein [Paraliomyxa miuraensis]